MNDFKPHDMLTRAQGVKYKLLAIPSIVLVASMFLTDYNSGIKYVSLGAFLTYLFIFILYRFKRTFIKSEYGGVFAPINGRIVDIRNLENGILLVINKPFFASCEIVTCTESDIINDIVTDKNNVSWRIENTNIKIFVEETVPFQGILVGLAPGYASCELFIPTLYEIYVTVGDNVEAGVTVVACILKEGQEGENE